MLIFCIGISFIAGILLAFQMTYQTLSINILLSLQKLMFPLFCVYILNFIIFFIILCITIYYFLKLLLASFICKYNVEDDCSDLINKKIKKEYVNFMPHIEFTNLKSKKIIKKKVQENLKESNLEEEIKKNYVKVIEEYYDKIQKLIIYIIDCSTITVCVPCFICLGVYLYSSFI